MTTPATDRRMPPYAGNDVSTAFAYDFYIADGSEIAVIEVDDSTTAQTALVLDTDYTVSGVGSESGGTITLVSALATGKTLYVIGITPLTQPTDFKNQSSYQGKRQERALDRLANQIKELDDKALTATDLVTLHYDAGGRDIEDIGAAYVDELYINGELVVPEGMAISLPPVQSLKFVIGNLAGTSYETKTAAELDLATVTAIATGNTAAPIIVATVAAMKALTGLASGTQIYTSCHTSPGNGAGRYRYNAAGSGTATFINVQPDTMPGRFELLDDVIDPYHAGCLLDGSTNDYVAFKEFAEVVTTKTKIGRKAIGKINSTAIIDWPVNSFFRGNGLVLDFSSSTITSGNPLMRCAATVTDLTTLSTSPVQGAVSFGVTSAAGISVGDVLIIYNTTNSSWSVHRAEYRAGEFVRVGDISGTTIYPLAPLYDGYSSGLKVLKLAGDTAKFCGMKIIQPSSSNIGLQLDGLVDPVIEDVRTGGSLYAGIEFKRCYDLHYRGTGFQSTPAVDDEYGVAVSNCHGGELAGAFYGGRHPISFGGGDYLGCVPCRRINVYASGYGNLGPTGSGDLHGNTEDIRFFGVTFANGSDVGGANHSFFGCRFPGNTNSGICLYGGELVRGKFKFTQCSFNSYINPNALGFAPIDISSIDADVAGNVHFLFQDCDYSAPAATTFFMRFSVTGGTATFGVQVKGGLITGSAGITQFLRLERSGGATTADFVRVENVDGLPAGATYCANIGAFTISKVKTPPMDGQTTVSVTSGNTSPKTQAVVFARSFPSGSVPRVLPCLRDDGHFGGDSVHVGITGVTNTGFNINIYTGDLSTFGATGDLVVDWVAVLDQN